VERNNGEWLGGYIPPLEGNVAMLQHILDAINTAHGCPVILAGDLNVDFVAEDLSKQNQEISTVLAAEGLERIAKHFYQRKQNTDLATLAGSCG
jgi:lysophospholipase L1-like esterase